MKPDIQAIIADAIDVYETGLEHLSEARHDQLDAVMKRRMECLNALESALSSTPDVDAATRARAAELMQLEAEFIDAVDDAVIQLRAEIVRTKSSQRHAGTYERASIS
jgi:hypothetical protein